MTAPSPATRRERFAITRPERLSLVGMIAVVGALHLVGWGALALLIAPQNYSLGDAGVFGLGLGLTAYLLGMRHAFDADHIAAIDNTTRKLLADRSSQARPLSVGFWFSLGHSTIVFVLVLLLGLGVRSVVSGIGDDRSTLREVGGLIGTAVSGVFLVLIGIVNLVILIGIVKIFRRMRHGDFDEAELEDHLQNRGLLNRVLGRVVATVRRPWHMYPVGMLFGLGFDTATEVSLLVLAGGAAASDLPWYAVLVLPIIFAAGMSLLDGIDGVFMCFAYGWAFLRPVRKVFYNITITSLSVVVALVIGMIELISILTERLGIESGPLAAIADLDLDLVGFALVGLFVVAWLVALAAWRFGRIEQKWEAGLRPTEGD